MRKKSFLYLGGTLILIGILFWIFHEEFFSYPKFDGKKFYLDSNYYNKGEQLESNQQQLEELIQKKATFVLEVYNNYCSLPIPCEDIFEEVIRKYQIDIWKIPFAEFKKTEIYQTVKLAPTIIIFKQGKIIGYLHANQDDDLERYQNVDAFEEWLNQYIILEK